MSAAARPTIEEWAMRVAEETATRSEDPHNKVGAVALNSENRVIATAYNGLAPDFEPPAGFWEDSNRDGRVPFIIHAEENLCSLFVRGAATRVFITLKPCGNRCINILIAHKVRQVYYRRAYHRDDSAESIAKFYGIELIHLPHPVDPTIDFAEMRENMVQHGFKIAIVPVFDVDGVSYATVRYRCKTRIVGLGSVPSAEFVEEIRKKFTHIYRIYQSPDSNAECQTPCIIVEGARVK